ncbi:MAG: BspA family leucine-rich repeat surface protein [Oscillospiraceae bacterium]|nr:BspA family leucine-rich repeat surface protein [Oscillospiraceae bacterium]
MNTVGACPCCGYDAAETTGKYPLALHPGSILNGRYILGHVLGQGGFGITYIALDYQTKERVAIKEYLPTEFAGRSTDSPSVLVYSGERAENFAYGMEQFLEEAKTLATFNGDSHIVRIYSYFEENSTAYFCMEYVDGLPLNRYMATKGGRLSPKEADRLLLPLMESLESVHAKGIVHRDIAPDNILVTSDGTAKLIDFGAARYSTGEKSQSLDVILKHGFAPFEQYMRRGRQGPWTDVYALAATYYYAITGEVPPEAVERRHTDTLNLTETKLNAERMEVLRQALAVSADERLQTMGQFRRAMEETAGRPKPTPGEKPAPASGGRKPKLPLILALAALAAIVVFGAVRLSGLSSAAVKEPAQTATAADTTGTAPEPTAESTPENWRNNRLRKDEVWFATNTGDDGDKAVFGSAYTRKQIRTVRFLDSIAEAGADAWDVSEARDGSVLAWVTPSGELYDLTIAADGGVLAPESCHVMFAGYFSLESFASNGAFHTENVKDMGWMFMDCNYLADLDLDGWDVSNVTDMVWMFNNCYSLTGLDIGDWDVSNVIDMCVMFDGCESLQDLDLSAWDVSGVTNMGGMFRDCRSLTGMDFSTWDVSRVTTMSGMFDGCSVLTDPDLRSWDVSRVTDMSLMFRYCISLTTPDFGDWDVSAVTSMSGMFDGCSKLTSLDLSGWDVSNVTDMSWMFYDCRGLKSLDLSGWDVSNVSDDTGMFENCPRMALNQSGWKRSK